MWMVSGCWRTSAVSWSTGRCFSTSEIFALRFAISSCICWVKACPWSVIACFWSVWAFSNVSIRSSNLDSSSFVFLLWPAVLVSKLCTFPHKSSNLVLSSVDLTLTACTSRCRSFIFLLWSTVLVSTVSNLLNRCAALFLALSMSFFFVITSGAIADGENIIYLRVYTVLISENYTCTCHYVYRKYTIPQRLPKLVYF